MSKSPRCWTFYFSAVEVLLFDSSYLLAIPILLRTFGIVPTCQIINAILHHVVVMRVIIVRSHWLFHTNVPVKFECVFSQYKLPSPVKTSQLSSFLYCCYVLSISSNQQQAKIFSEVYAVVHYRSIGHTKKNNKVTIPQPQLWGHEITQTSATRTTPATSRWWWPSATRTI